MGVGVFCTGKRGWVGCDTNPENAFFEFFQRRLSTCPTPGAPCIPLGWRPQPPAHPDRLHSTGSSAGRARYARQTAHNRPRTDTHARTLDTLHRYAPDTRQAAPGRSGRWWGWRAGNSSIMRIMIALSQAWYIDSNMNKYHKDILLFLVIVNCYLSIDIQPY